MTLYETALQWAKLTRQLEEQNIQLRRITNDIDNLRLSQETQAVTLRKSVGPNVPVRLFDIGGGAVAQVTETGIRIVSVEKDSPKRER